MIAYRIWQVAGWTMLHYLWVGGAVGTAMLAVRWSLRSAAPNVRYLAALAGLVLMTSAPPLIAVYVMHDLGPLPNSPLPPVAVEQSAEESTTAPPATVSEVLQPRIEPAAPLPAAARPVRGELRFATILDLAARYLPWLWIVGAPFVLLLTTGGMVGAERLRRLSRPAEDAAIAELCRRLAGSLKLSRRVGVAVCDRIAGPILVGIVRPVVLLPAVALAGWDPQQLEMVLLHELVHVRRWDNLVNLVQRIVESVLFFHPMIWVVSAWVRREREHCCDAVVVAHTRQPRAYAQLLVALAEQLSRSPLATSPLTCPQVVSSMAQRPLVARIRRILKKEEQSMQVSRKTVGMVFLGLAGVALLIGGYWSRVGRAQDVSPETKSRNSADQPQPAQPANSGAAPKAIAAAAQPETASAPIPPELQKPITGKNFVVIPLNDATELQQNLCWTQPETRLFVLVNGSAIVDEKNNQLDSSALDFFGLLTSLQKY
jgi:beta-lactamase regulating signal transducer with metallopeptidase domain